MSSPWIRDNPNTLSIVPLSPWTSQRRFPFFAIKRTFTETSPWIFWLWGCCAVTEVLFCHLGQCWDCVFLWHVDSARCSMIRVHYFVSSHEQKSSTLSKLLKSPTWVLLLKVEPLFHHSFYSLWGHCSSFFFLQIVWVLGDLRSSVCILKTLTFSGDMSWR